MSEPTQTDRLTWLIAKIIGEQNKVEAIDDKWEILVIQHPRPQINVRTIALRIEEEIEKHNIKEDLRLKQTVRPKPPLLSSGYRLAFLFMLWIVIGNLIALSVAITFLRWVA